MKQHHFHLEAYFFMRMQQGQVFQWSKCLPYLLTYDVYVTSSDTEKTLRESNKIWQRVKMANFLANTMEAPKSLQIHPDC